MLNEVKYIVELQRWNASLVEYLKIGDFHSCQIYAVTALQIICVDFIPQKKFKLKQKSYVCTYIQFI